MSPGTRSLSLLCLLALLAGCKSKPRQIPVEGPGTTIHAYTDQSLGLAAEPATEEELLDENRILARVNGEIITVRSIRAEYEEALATRGPMEPAELRELLDGWTVKEVRSRIVYAAAKKAEVTVAPEYFEKVVEEAEKLAAERGTTLDEDLASQGVPRWEWEEKKKRELTVNQFMMMLGGRAQPISEDTRAVVDPRPRPVDVWCRYERAREALRVPAHARVDAIYVRWVDHEADGASRNEAIQRAREHALALRTRIEAGESFEAIREENQGEAILTEPIVKGSRRDPVERFAFSAEVGDVSPVIAMPSMNFLILKLLERMEAGILPFEKVQDGMSREMMYWSGALASLTIESLLLRDAVITPPRVKARVVGMVEQELRQALMELSM